MVVPGGRVSWVLDLGKDEGLRRMDFAHRGAWLIRQVDHARVFRVIGHTRPVEGRVNLHLVAEGMLDRRAFEILIGIAGSRQDVSDGERVQRPAGVHVRLAEVRVALGIRRGKYLRP